MFSSLVSEGKKGLLDVFTFNFTRSIPIFIFSHCDQYHHLCSMEPMQLFASIRGATTPLSLHMPWLLCALRMVHAFIDHEIRGVDKVS